MNIKSACILIMLAIPVSLQAFEHSGNSSNGICKNEKGTTRCNLSSTGTINLSQTRNNVKTKNIVFTLNDNVKGVLKLHQIKGKNKDMIKGVFFVDNTSPEKSYIQYRVIFKDKAGAIAQSKGEIHLAQGKNQKMKFGSILLAPEDMKNISSYQIKMVSSNKKTL